MQKTKPKLKISLGTHEMCVYACQNWHYSKCVPAGKLFKFGVFEDDKFIGVVIFSRGANNSLGSPYGLTQLECCELTRIALSEHKTEVSKIVSIALKILKKHNQGLRLVISFADSEQGHIGSVYQAGNWVYAGMTKSADEYLVHGVRMHGRSMRAKYGSHIGKSFIKIVKGSSKYRYLFALDKETKEKISKIKIKYPKRIEHESNATTNHVVEASAILSNTLQ